MKVVKFNAIWCSGCLVMRPIWNELKECYPEIEFIDYDYDEFEELAQKYEVGSILPVAILYQNDKEIMRIIGEKSKKEVFSIFEGVMNETN